MTHIVIDGYNYINRLGSEVMGPGSDLDIRRRSFLEKLFQYKKARGGKITVVFDAYKNFSLGRQRENYKGVDVVYSAQNETADEVMIGWIRQKRSGMIAVTSDRAIIDEAKEHGVPFLTPVKLAEMIAGAAAEPHMGLAQDGRDDDEEEDRGKKKGNPRKLPKKLRKVAKSLKKL